MKQRLITLGLFALLGIVLTTFVLTPFTGDIYVFLGSAHQMEFFEGNFFERAFHTWDVKGIFARTFMCALYRSALLFSDFASLKFEIYVRLIYLIFSLILLLFSARLLRRHHKRWWLLFMILTIGLFATHYSSHLQHEMTVVLLMLLSYALIVSDDTSTKWRLLKDFFAGLLLGSLPYFKSIFIILPPIVISAVCLVQPNIISICRQTAYKRLYALILGGLIMGLSGLSLILFLYPEEIQDILDVSAFQNTLISGGFLGIGNSLYLFGIGLLVKGLLANPIIAIGSTAAFFNLLYDFKTKNFQTLPHRFMLWFIPSGFVLLSNCFFAYHYYLFAFASVVECLVFVKQNKHSNLRFRVPILGFITLEAIIYLYFMSVFSENFEDYINSNQIQHTHHTTLHALVPDLSTETILHLDDGSGSYLAGGRSYLKYQYPLPLQRISEHSKFNNLPCRLKCKNETMNYTGKYIVLDKLWFCHNDNQQHLIDKINQEYLHISDIHYMIREWNLIGKPKFTNRALELHKRRDN